jgi:hypothetical protein
MLRQSEKSQLILLVAVAFAGTFLWRLSFHFKQQSDWQPANQEALQHFKVVAFQDGRPSVVPLLQVPQGSTFYFEPAKEKEYIQKLQEEGDIVIDLSDRSQSSSEHKTTLEILNGATVERYYYQAGRESLTPLGWSRVDGSDLSQAAKDGFLWALGAVLALGLVVLAARFGGQPGRSGEDRPVR